MSSPVTAGPSPEGFTSRLLQTGLLIDKYYTPLLCFFGALGNSLSLAVFCLDSKYRSQSSSYYLSALAVSDTGFLLNLFAVWLENIYGGVITSDLMCPLVMYLGQITCFMSVYLTVAFSIERYVAVHYPFSRPRICTRSKAKKGILGLTVIALLLFSYVCFIAKVVEQKSSPTAKELHNKNDNRSIKITNNFSTFNVTKVEEEHGEIDPVSISSRIIFHDVKTQHKNVTDEISETEEKTRDISPIFLESTSFMGKEKEKIMITRMGMETTTTPKYMGYLSSFHRQMSTLESSGNNNKNSNRSINLAPGETQDVKVENDENKQMSHKSHQHHKWDYFHLIDDNGIIQEQESGGQKQSQLGNENADPSTSFGTTKTNNGTENITFPATNNQQQNFSSSNLNKSNGDCRYRCSVPKQYHTISKYANYFDTAITLIIPFLLITYFNVRISMSVWKLRDQRQQIVASPSVARSKMTTLVVTDNRPGRKLLVTKLANNHSALQRHHSHSVDISNGIRNNHSEDDLIEDEDGKCHWEYGQEKEETDTGGVRFDSNLAAGICHFNAATSNTFKEDRTETMTLNECHQMSLETAKPIPLRGGNDTVAKPKFSIFHRSRQHASYQQPQNHHSHHHHSQHSSSEVRVTKTLLLVSTVFLVLNLPLHAIRCTQFIQLLTGTQESKEIYRALHPWANIVFNTNFAVNFLLYCASGRNFRKSLKHITSRILRKSSSSSSRRPSQYPPRLSQSSAHNHYIYPPHNHDDHRHRRKSSGHLETWRGRRRRSSTPERTGTRNMSNCCNNPTVTTVVRGPQGAEFLELEDVAGIGVENSSMYLGNNNRKEETITV